MEVATMTLPSGKCWLFVSDLIAIALLDMKQESFKNK